MSSEQWKCSCGTVNTGNFCTLCGKTRAGGNPGRVEEFSEEYLKLQIKQQELMNAQEEKRIAMQQENERKKREYDVKMREYNEQVSQVSTKVLKSWAGSWIVLVLAICASVAAACSLISLFTNFSSGWMSIIIPAVKLLLNCLVCIGFWRSYIMGKKKDLTLNAGGIRMLKGVVKFYQIIAYILCVLVIVVFIFLFVGMKSCADDITDKAGQVDLDLSGANEAFTGILVGILIALVVVFGVIIFFFSKAVGFSKEVLGSFDNKVLAGTSTTAVAVLFFIVGGFTLIGAIGTVAATDMLSGLLDAVGGETLSGLGLFAKADIADMFSQFATAGMYIFGGILAIKFSGLSGESFRQKQAIPKPEMEI